MENYYDERSHIDKAFQNWNGSIYWVQGMQDWNVDPHQVFGGLQALTGISTILLQGIM